jgi:hypothetical protein
MWSAAGLAGRSHYCRAHRLFSHARWDLGSLGLLLARLIVTRFVPSGVALMMMMMVDDTLFHRYGAKTHGVFWQHDGSAKGRRRDRARELLRRRRFGDHGAVPDQGNLPAGPVLVAHPHIRRLQAGSFWSWSDWSCDRARHASVSSPPQPWLTSANTAKRRSSAAANGRLSSHSQQITHRPCAKY